MSHRKPCPAVPNPSPGTLRPQFPVKPMSTETPRLRFEIKLLRSALNVRFFQVLLPGASCSPGSHRRLSILLLRKVMLDGSALSCGSQAVVFDPRYRHRSRLLLQAFYLALADSQLLGSASDTDAFAHQ